MSFIKAINLAGEKTAQAHTHTTLGAFLHFSQLMRSICRVSGTYNKIICTFPVKAHIPQSIITDIYISSTLKEI